jgi:hypothetical protein
MEGSRQDVDARQSIPARRGVADLRRLNHHNDAANRSDGRHLGHVGLESHHAYPSKHGGPAAIARRADICNAEPSSSCVDDASCT